MDVAIEDVPAAVIFQHQRVSVVKEAGVAAALHHPPQAPERIVAQGRRDAARGCGGQPVFAVIDVAIRAVRGEIAVGIVVKASGHCRMISTVGIRKRLEQHPGQAKAILSCGTANLCLC